MSEEKKKLVKKKKNEENAIGYDVAEKPVVENADNKKKNKKNRTTKQKVIRGILIALLIIVILAAIAITTLYFIFKHYYDQTNYQKDEDVIATAMSSEQISSEIADIKESEMIQPVESSLYDDMNQTAEVTIAPDESSSIYESVKESISDIEGSQIYDDIKESMLAELIKQEQAANPDMSPEDIKASLEANVDVMIDLDHKIQTEVGDILSSKASEAMSEKDSSALESVSESVHESISDAAHESAVEIVESMESALESQSQAMNNQETVVSDNVYNLLLIGVDFNNYSDTIMLVSINEAKNTIYMTSIMRDTCVNAAGLGMVKLNNTYRFGGAPMLIQTIENNLKIKIDNYAYVTFPGMWSIFDAAGGLDMSITDAEVPAANVCVYEMANVYGFNANDHLFTQGGYQHMTGVQVLSYCRVRRVGNADFERTERQRTAITALFNKMRSAGIGTLNTFLNNALPAVSHNIPSGKVMELLMGAGSYINYNLVGLRVPADGTYSAVAGSGMLITDFAANSAYVHQTIY